MQFFDKTIPIVAIVVGAVAASIILGPLLRRHKGSISESSMLVRLGLLVILAIAVGITIFSWSWFAWSIFLIIPYLIIPGGISLFCGLLTLFVGQENRDRKSGSG